jgi:endonuclease YncB( thermonuclease family)
MKARRFCLSTFALGLACALAGLVTTVAVPPGAQAEPRSRVFLNGKPVEVFFSDGDSFRMHGGPYSGDNARLAGFNTLESFGPVHQWGDWHPYELYVIAKKATLNGRRGVWHCTSEGERDTYGRVLIDCPDLAVDQLRKGLAHALNIDDSPAQPAYLRAQAKAIQERRGMWAHGVPDFLLTSLHSIDERPQETTYNRMVSTRDGHTEKWTHADRYGECEWVCATEIRAADDEVRDVALSLRHERELADVLADLPNLHLVEAVDRFARLGELPEYLEEHMADALVPPLRKAKRQGRLGEPKRVVGACALYVQFERRYGRGKAGCLKGHGNWSRSYRQQAALELGAD